MALLMWSGVVALPVCSYAQSGQTSALEILVQELVAELLTEGRNQEALALFVLFGDITDELEQETAPVDGSIDIEIYPDGAWVYYQSADGLFEADFVTTQTGESAIRREALRRFDFVDQNLVEHSTATYAPGEELGDITGHYVDNRTFMVVDLDEPIALYQEGFVSMYMYAGERSPSALIRTFSDHFNLNADTLRRLIQYENDDSSNRELGLVNEDTLEVLYRVRSAQDLDVLRGEADSDAEVLWEVFVQVAGDRFVDRYVDSYVAFSDGDNPTIAYVGVDEPDNTSWQLGVNIDSFEEYLVDRYDRTLQQETYEVMIHEYAHIVTFNETQFEFGIETSEACPYYYSSVGCPYSGSVLEGFSQEFWHTRDLERIENGRSVYRTGAFVSPYAATNPAEDFAETFAYFVYRSAPNPNTDGYAKIIWMYTQDELVDLRDDIRERIGL